MSAGMITEIVRALVEAGATPQLILAAVEAAEKEHTDKLVQRRARDAERQARFRATHSVTSRDVTVTVASRASAHAEPSTSDSENPITKTTTREKKQTSVRARTREGDDVQDEFNDAFWPVYPHKVGKPKALTAFRAARRKAELTAIIGGLQRYLRDKPADRPWLNPATFLNQERWADAPAQVATGPPLNGHREPTFADIHRALTQGKPDEPAPDHDDQPTLDLEAEPH